VSDVRVARTLGRAGDRLKLAVFSPNMAGGTSLTSIDGPPVVTWPEQVAIAQAAERANFDAIIPVARWRGPSPSHDPERHRSFDTFTWAAGLAMATSHIDVFATFHVPLTHPLQAAKQIATVDHISNGRLGVNIVAGWNADEFAMFDHTLRAHDDRYGYANEWMDFLTRILTTPQPFDVLSTYFTAREVISQPLPVHRPLVMSAGFSEAGRRFAAQYGDIAFAIFPDRETTRRATSEIKALARNTFGRDIAIFGAAHVLCAPSQEAADERYHNAIHLHGDRQAAANALRLLMGGSQSMTFSDEMAEAAMFGFFATPIVGTPDAVVERLHEMSNDGLDGVAVSWLDYGEGLEQWSQVIEPRLIARELRSVR
jgi:dimethylsulfone monooxygenase